jgi:hypothetical protein
MPSPKPRIGTGTDINPDDFNRSNNMGQPRFSVSEAEALPPEVVALEREISRLPQPSKAHMEPLVRQLVDTLRRRRRVMAMAHEALSQLRLEVKYLMFDLEATRVEKQKLEQQLDGGDWRESES